MPQRGPFASSNLSWTKRFTSLSSSSILWYKREWETKDVTSRYGGFPNVPPIGTRGCINYNPMLLKRQLGYAMFESSRRPRPHIFHHQQCGPTQFSREESEESLDKHFQNLPRVGKEEHLSQGTLLCVGNRKISICQDAIPF